MIVETGAGAAHVRLAHQFRRSWRPTASGYYAMAALSDRPTGPNRPPAVEDHPDVLSVVFVCTGNICRSPVAEIVFRDELARAGLADQVTVSSAGTGGYHVGEPADERAAALLRANGYPTDHVASRLDAARIEDADLLVALDRTHLRALPPEKARLLREFDPAAPPNSDVPDPYYGEDAAFDEVLVMVRAAMPGLVDWVRARL
jgi:protein-tyrosine phosphatase